MRNVIALPIITATNETKVENLNIKEIFFTTIENFFPDTYEVENPEYDDNEASSREDYNVEPYIEKDCTIINSGRKTFMCAMPIMDFLNLLGITDKELHEERGLTLRLFAFGEGFNFLFVFTTLHYEKQNFNAHFMTYTTCYRQLFIDYSLKN